MKKLFIMLVAVSMILPATKTFAQQDQGQITISPGIGYSLINTIFNLSSSLNNDFFSTPVINICGDYGLSERFSVGIAAAYQTAGYKYGDYSYTDANGNIVTEDFKESWSCINVGVRPLFHFGNSEDLDLYAGLRVGYTIWNWNSTSSDPNWVESSFDLGAIGVQPLFGARYYFNDVIGINGEVGFGTYIALLGLSLRFGG